MIAIACDHAGIDLKPAVIAVLDELGIPYHDFGTYSHESVDYPVYGARAAHAVASGSCDRGIILCGARLSERATRGAVIVQKGSRVDPIAPHIDRGGAANLISPEKQVSKNCRGFAVSGYLIDVAKLEDAEMEQWKAEYPEAFARDYDPAIGINYNSWVIE